ncbi:putative dna excision repair protein rad2 [Phaeomoniella chlamydospora]|uniref:Putative dna excision repair protein rad2 n=1 Tax=Phaeomoniella chlamydospora TaxID=158046 RepID=A0A0G2ESK7_PHACM|nr:putative dna excision repair protein rad2 [Phaeomoniella chlamydospora]
MGVTGLWTVVHPSARPTNLTTLNRKRLAVDASIWIYQFLKAVRDKEGNVLRNSHVVGFFRRICKLLYHGIKPVFVFDGGAPALKRQTISSRKRRREGRREDAVRTAGKMLAMQMQRRAEEEEQKRKDRENGRIQQEEELPPQEDLVYVDEIGMSSKERQQNRTFRKKDAYHLPDLDVSLTEMGAPNDPRIMSQHELEEYARQFHSGEDINLYDFSKIDFDSPFFLSLPAADRYNILNAARLRSRLRMGYSKEQLDGMFPDRMAFSKFQIERVRERNELTQRLMHVNGMNGEDFLSQGARIAGEKGKEYVLVRNDGVEGGWALGVVSNKNEGQKDQPIDVDTYGQIPKEENEDEEWEDADGFEDIPIEGLNRLPKNLAGKGREMDYDASFQDRVDQIAKKRKEVYNARKQKALSAVIEHGQVQLRKPTPAPTQEDPESLFIPENQSTAHHDEDGMNELFEDVDMAQGGSDDEDLQKAIAMSLQKDGFGANDGGFVGDAFNDVTAKEGRDIARRINEKSSRPMIRRASNVSSDEEGFDLQAALAESRKSKYQAKGPESPGHRSNSPFNIQSKSLFDGPLPFESLNLGQSLLGKKKSEKIEQELSGGFERRPTNEKPSSKPLPPWFSGKAPTKDTVREPAYQQEDNDLNKLPVSTSRAKIQRQEAKEVIDVDASPILDARAIDVEESDASSVQQAKFELDDSSRTQMIDTELRMDHLADLARAEPPRSQTPTNQVISSEQPPEKTVASPCDDEMEWSETDEEELAHKENSRMTNAPPGGNFQLAEIKQSSPEIHNVGSPDSPRTHELIEKANIVEDDDDEDDVEFEDVTELNDPPSQLPRSVEAHPHQQNDSAERFPFEEHISEIAEDVEEAEEYTANYPDQPTVNVVDEGEAYLSDSDDEVMRNLAIEAEEHARFAATLNNPLEPLPTSKPTIDYEAELRQLRNQQKRDRRDADEVTQTMITECQMLLSHFGLPYITAPMEAEAQCAELVHLGLVDGIITDDSDVFLFGGTRIYKNMFNAAKFVECYLSSDLEREYNLTREKLISFAHLLGSDYTEGIPGVGPVTALEILAEFPELSSFRDWWSSIQLTNFSDIDPSTEPHYPFLKKYRKQLPKLFLPPNFPDPRVDQAYLDPEVDSSPQSFQWGVPDLASLRSFLMSTIGWSQERTDEVLVPVIRDMNRRDVEGTQSNITKFFEGSVGVGSRGFVGDRNGNGNSRSARVGVGKKKNRITTTKTTRNLELDHANENDDDDEDEEDDDNEEDVAAQQQNQQNSEIFAPRVRKSDRMSRAFGRLRDQAERNRLNQNQRGNKNEGGAEVENDEQQDEGQGSGVVEIEDEDEYEDEYQPQKSNTKRKQTETRKSKGKPKARNVSAAAARTPIFDGAAGKNGNRREKEKEREREREKKRRKL